MRYALSVIEVARALGVSPNTIRMLINAGKLPHIRAGRRVLVPVSALEHLGKIAESVKQEPARAGGRR